MSLKLLIFCLLKLANVGFYMSLELVECGLDGLAPRVPIEDGVCCLLDYVGLSLCLMMVSFDHFVYLEWVRKESLCYLESYCFSSVLNCTRCIYDTFA